MARPLLERVTARIAVSATARRVQVERLGGDATEIPNGVDVARFAHGPALDLPPAVRVGYVGRFDEPRKGMPWLLAALRRVVADRPDVRLLVVGRGDGDRLLRTAGPGWPSGSTCSGRSTRRPRPPRCARSRCSAHRTAAGRASGWY